MDVNGVEEDLCRVCRDGVSEGPLFHPCACSGSIRWVHEACLDGWLSVTGRSKCELCNETLHYTKVFSESPDRLPLTMLVRRIAQSVITVVAFLLRIVLVNVVWLAIIPYLTFWITNSIFFTSHFVGQLIRGGLPLTPTAQELARLHGLHKFALEGALPEETHRISAAAVFLERAQNICTSAAGSSLTNWTCGITSDAAVEPKATGFFDLIIADILTGQIITAAVVVVFVVAFLFREWIMQNGPLPAPIPVEPAVVALLPGFGAPIDGIPAELLAPAAEEIRNILANMPTGQIDEDGWYEDEDIETRQREAEQRLLDARENKRHPDNDWWDQDDQPTASTSLGVPTTPTERLRRPPIASTSDFRFDFDENGVPSNIPDITPALDAAAASPDPGRPIRSLPTPTRNRRAAGPRTRSQGSPTSSRSVPLPAVRLPIPPPPPPPLNAAQAATHFLGVPPPAPVQFEIVDGVPVQGDHPLDVHDHGHDFAEDIFDDLGAVMEAVGMKGSLLILLQNSLVILTVLIVILGTLVWLPLMTGKVLASINIFSKVFVPVRIVRVISDPLLDAGFKMISKLSYPLLWIVDKMVPTLLSPPLSTPLSTPILTVLPAKALRTAAPAVVSVTKTIAKSYPSLFKSLFLPAVVIPPPVVPPPIVVSVVVALPPLSTFARIVKDISILHSRAIQGLKSFPLYPSRFTTYLLWKASTLGASDTVRDRIECIVLGYTSILGAIALYFFRTSEGNTLHRSFQEVIRKQMLLVKVISFVFVEIVVFPSACGIVLNLVSLPLFPETTIVTRIAYYARAPASGCFLTWLAGTCFMFGFSIAVDTLRNIIRVGSLYFIRDPSNNDHHPLREILSRGSLAQARKIAISGVLYSGVIISCFGVSIAFLRYVCVGILPLRWSYHSLAEIPIDLVLYRYVLPFTLGQINPRSLLRTVFVIAFKKLARQFRLSHLLFGIRAIEEEGPTTHGKTVVFGAKEVEGEGSWARVPASDNIKIRAGRKVFIPVTEAGQPFNEENRAVIGEQIIEMMTVRRDDAYQIIYLPPRWKLRLAGFIGSMWLATISTGIILFVIPLSFGREILSMIFPDSPVHDLYSLLVGLHWTAAFLVLGRKINDCRPRLPTPQELHFAFQSIVAVALIGIVLPLTLAVFLQLSLVFPFSSADIPTFDILQLWCFGAIMLGILVSILRLEVYRFSMRRQIVFIISNDWEAGNRLVALWRSNVLALQYTHELITAILSTLIVNTMITTVDIYSTPALPREILVGIQKAVYFSSFVVVMIIVHAEKLMQWGEGWAKRVREEEFLVSRRLRNYIPGGEDDVVVS